ncbi:RNA polymerase factor sigma-54 [Staphylospora marina]|uniref:RNA polymerase factor sigma-54 n=1 Tax=Staphylospora marina TaxID=2490858 RepID=UPI000F5B8B3E|nr:RNA polymerase factor sigma-54 [Staphylospora marina]
MALQMNLGLFQEQRMKMVLTPELRQAIQLLQGSALDLMEHLEEQLAENPLLELEDGADLLRWLEYLDRPGRPAFRADRSVEMPEPEPQTAGPETLAEVLEAQLFEYDLDPVRKRVCRELIHLLDEKGYIDPEWVSVCKRFLVSDEVAEECLGVIQSMDPAGVGARSLAECVEIQLRRRERCHPLAIPIARDHLWDVAEGKWRKIAAALGADVADVQEAVDEIRSCNPKPGAAYTAEAPRYVVPDVIVEKVDGEYAVRLSESEMPGLVVNNSYKALLRGRTSDEETVRYVKNWMQSALWLIRGIEQRRDTIHRVAEAIVNRQREFLDGGMEYLKPLTLKQIAEEVGVHESTVSRVTRGKYMQTPRGLYPFRFFFPSGLSTTAGDDLASGTVKEKIRSIIDGENRQQPLSDRQIAEMLSGEGIRISRRTVAKYREEMGIPSSNGRKRFL